MKFWKRIFMYSFILFFIVFNIGGFVLIENSHQSSLKREVQRGLSEHLSIYSGMNMIVENRMYADERFGQSFLYDHIKSFLEKFHDKKVYVELLDQKNKVFFTSVDFKIDIERKELKNPLENRRKYIIRDLQDRTYLFVTNRVKIKKESFKLTYIRDITEIYEERNKQYKFLFQLELLILVLLSVGMYVISKHITKPIYKLIDAIEDITRGNYSNRVEIYGEDEIGKLAKKFNEMTDALDEKIKELEKNTKEKQRFIDNLTHELKTPLTSIIGYADFLRSTQYNEEVHIKGLNYIYQEGKRLEKLSSKMMNLILLKKQNFVMKKENLKEVVLEIEEIFKYRLKEKDIKMIIDAKELYKEVEKDLIKNLIINLVDNGIKASFEGSYIYINLYEEKEKIVIEVIDEGSGIKEEDIKKIFEPFFMGDQSRSKKNNGAGLGLSICDEIVKLHKGNLKIESNINKGTTIKIIFD
ncbi:sensor histidine kinase [Inediibacterium massiliense]|uniref:sensor histidine kinase n=1 Tax=Inediibacterium massiliense TaxID=1658111 RepID=UPI0006B416AD|nr:HAMP domain-containing sensor histidine kinase [Inediibacterium massiliense]